MGQKSLDHFFEMAFVPQTLEDHGFLAQVKTTFCKRNHTWGHVHPKVKRTRKARILETLESGLMSRATQEWAVHTPAK